MLPTPYQSLNSLEPLKLLVDPIRLQLLKILMSRAATLSQLATHLGSYPAQIKHHLKLLEDAGLVAVVATRPVRGFEEKYYRASALAYLVQIPVIPLQHDEHKIIVFSSHDFALELMGNLLRRQGAPSQIVVVPVGSLDALIALRQGVCHMAGCHLLDLQTGTYNLPFVRHLFPDRPMQIIHLARRLQGLIVPPGNPLMIREFADLAQPEVKFINRQPGSGTRIWLNYKLQSMGIQNHQIPGYNREAKTHHEVAKAIASGEANVGIGLFAAALEYEVGFIPLFEEAYDLVVPQETAENPDFIPVRELLHSAEFQMSVQILGGYYPRRMGEVFYI